MFLLARPVVELLELLRELARREVPHARAAEGEVLGEVASVELDGRGCEAAFAVLEEAVAGVIEGVVGRLYFAERFLREDAPRLRARIGERDERIPTYAVASAGADDDYEVLAPFG